MDNINISNISLSKLKREDIKKQFANDSRLDKILFIFDKINSLDGEIGNELSVMDLAEMKRVKSGKRSDGSYKMAFLEGKWDGIVNDFELNEYIKEAKGFYGDDIEVEDFRKFLGFAASKGHTSYQKHLEEVSQKTGMSQELIEKLGGAFVAESYKVVEENGKKFYRRELEGFYEIYDETGNLLEQSFSGYLAEDENTQEIKKFDNSGKVTSESYINKQTGEQTRYIYNKDNSGKDFKLNIKNGVAIRQSYSQLNDLNERNMKLEDIVFGAGTTNSTKVSFKYDENNHLTGIDIKDSALEEDKPHGFITDGEVFLTYIPKRTTIDDATVASIQQMVDGGARYGEDYELKIVDGKLQIVPKIVNESDTEIPPLIGEAFNKYKELTGSGIHAGEDFDVIYEENGNFRYNLNNNQAKGYDANYRSEIYDKDGNFVSSITVKDKEVIYETMVNGNKQTVKTPFDKAFLQLITEKNFSIAGEILGRDDVISGGYNIYPSAEKYKELTGRELIADVYDAIQIEKDDKKLAGMQNLMSKLQPHGAPLDFTRDGIINNYYKGYNLFKEILNFNPQNSKIADMLPKINRVQKGKNAYIEQINNNSFDVSFSNGIITVSKNGATPKTIDVSALPEDYVKQVFMDVNSQVLYDIALYDVRIKLDDHMNDESIGGSTNGYYRPSDNSITLDPNALIGRRALLTIAHEAGHMCDYIDDKDNAIKVIKEKIKDPMFMLGRDKPLTVQELLDNLGTFQPVSVADDKLNELFDKEMQNFRQNCPEIISNAAYALTNLQEFFAESYALLNTGNCKSEYVIATYFPESFSRIKELIDINRTKKEQSH